MLLDSSDMTEGKKVHIVLGQNHHIFDDPPDENTNCFSFFFLTDMEKNACTSSVAKCHTPAAMSIYLSKDNTSGRAAARVATT